MPGSASGGGWVRNCDVAGEGGTKSKEGFKKRVVELKRENQMEIRWRRRGKGSDIKRKYHVQRHESWIDEREMRGGAKRVKDLVWE